MQNKVLYKYRGLSNIPFALDIIVNQRVFAAEFKKLNDPMSTERGVRTIHNDSNDSRLAVLLLRQ